MNLKNTVPVIAMLFLERIKTRFTEMATEPR